MKIIVADDLPAIRMLTKKILLDSFPACSIEEVGNGNELLNSASSRPVDLVITDISMPVMNGLDAIGELRRRSFISPVLVLSSHTEEEYIRMSINAGASGYVHKFRICQDLVHTIGMILNSVPFPSMSPPALIPQLPERHGKFDISL